ncbi:FKBP-type peptidyl-prolyl cis-trans isomerase [Oceanospirillum maris]|uniref:FKBP-type peptidyl-prolyl cis-trans isomerase n=1 Tax=Oceanospirillum maris TaxID=64977 RepID=UPI0003F6D40C|nr:peptidylprolyl isomerase [Oceanospirillum maris]
MSEQQIGPGKQVTLHFALKLAEKGAVVDSTFDKDPVRLIVGDGNLPEGFEKPLHGLTAGTKQTFEVAPENAFGQHNPSNIQKLPRAQFAPDLNLEPGLMLSFADKANGELPGVVVEFDDELVSVDFNHPLAGHTLTFEVEILAVEDAPEQA